MLTLAAVPLLFAIGISTCGATVLHFTGRITNGDWLTVLAVAQSAAGAINWFWDVYGVMAFTGALALTFTVLARRADARTLAARCPNDAAGV